ncbi:MAG: hypothetical protein LLF94_11825 [Chlamydiales bacterium]|nr:hypothetical protein [Chlamydiales bacterium]
MSVPVSFSLAQVRNQHFDVEDRQDMPQTTSRVARYAGVAFMGLGVIVGVGTFIGSHLLEISWVDSSVASGLGAGLGGCIFLGGFALIIRNHQRTAVNEI